jgi:F0F1-type ATP synthase assembly protein I
VSFAPPPSPSRYPGARIAAWQALATLAIAALGAWWAGWQGFVSGLLGGLVNLAAGVVFAMLVSLGRPATGAATVRTMIRAEAAKITVIVLQLWLVLSAYRDVVVGAFIAAFIVTVLVSQAAILIRD